MHIHIPRTTCTSHFSRFLDPMCTHIDFRDREPRTFEGGKGRTLTRLVENYPESESFFELSNETMKFTFEEAGARKSEPMKSSTWVEKIILVKMGYIKLVQREDQRRAATAGLITKQLAQPSSDNAASHMHINQLNRRLKVKAALAATMCQNRHARILDELTNYLGRDGLRALVTWTRAPCDRILVKMGQKVALPFWPNFCVVPKLSVVQKRVS